MKRCPEAFFINALNRKKPAGFYLQGQEVRSTGLEPVPVAGHAPQTCAYADSATTADEQMNYTARKVLCQELIRNADHWLIIDGKGNNCYPKYNI